jgi:hypothetical protein
MMKGLRLIIVVSGIVGVVLAQLAWADDKHEPVIKLQ